MAQFEFGTNVKETQALIEENLAGLGLPDAVDPSVNALNINASPVVIASIAATSDEGLARAAQIASDEIVPEIEALGGVNSADITGNLEQQLLITLDPTAMAEAGVARAGSHGRPAGQQPHHPVGPAPGRRNARSPFRPSAG